MSEVKKAWVILGITGEREYRQEWIAGVCLSKAAADRKAAMLNHEQTQINVRISDFLRSLDSSQPRMVRDAATKVLLLEICRVSSDPNYPELSPEDFSDMPSYAVHEAPIVDDDITEAPGP